MATLNKALRNQLEKVVAQARTIAVAGAKRALDDELTVGAGRPWQGMGDDQAKLRNDLRAHGRQLGDKRDPRSGEQETKRLVQACAYEHWNRMLFARFLAENNLLLDPEHGLSLTMDDVQELAREQGRDWMELASELAQRMLLSVFNPRDPVLRVKLPVETRLQLDQKLASLPSEVFLADDSLGWVYQFWQEDEKERVNKSEVKIGGDELPAVTQLFTEDYMVLFLLENTLGAWWTAKRSAAGLDPKLPGYEWTYLRLNEDGTPAAGSLHGWPKTAREITVLDPCMGSGHFLTFALPILARMRQVEEELSLRAAIAAVLKDNLFGLELDARCSQIAAFNLALTAWRLTGEHSPLPQLNLACSGLGTHASESDWVSLAGEDGRAREGMRRLYSLFQDAPTLGSLIDPLRLKADVVSFGTDEILPLLERALSREEADEEKRELIVAAQGVLTAFRLLARQYTLVATNVPYLGRGKQSAELAEYCAEFHTRAKADLATTFVDRSLKFCLPSGTVSIVTPMNWWFLGTYRDFRATLLTHQTLEVIVALGEEAWQAFGDRGPMAALMIIERRPSEPDQSFGAISALELREISDKIMQLKLGRVLRLKQREEFASADHRITVDPPVSGALLGAYAACNQEIGTADANRYILKFWEIIDSEKWEFYQMAPVSDKYVSGCHSVLRWERGNGSLAKSEQARICGQPAWGKKGIAIAVTRQLSRTQYLGGMFDCTVGVITPLRATDFDAVRDFVLSDEFTNTVRQVDKALSVTESSFLKVPFEVDHWGKEDSGGTGRQLDLSTPPPLDQWVFSGAPKDCKYPLQVAMARSLAFSWPRQRGISFPGFPAVLPDAVDTGTEDRAIVALLPRTGHAGCSERLRVSLAKEYGEKWSADKLAELLGDAESLDDWLRHSFFEHHAELFHDRPFIWHIWDGQLYGFHAFVNYHSLTAPNGEGRKTLERLTYTLLNDWIERQRSEVERKVDGAETRLTAAVHLQSELKKILEGEPPYDIFIRWKPLHDQPIGWEPDINDGVRINIRPFLNAKPYRGSRNSCIFRFTPKIKHGKDRGKEPWRPKEEYPWFWGWDERTQDFTGGDTFDGARWNDLHYSNEMKRKARAKKAEADASKS